MANNFTNRLKGKLLTKALEQLAKMNARDCFEMFKTQILPFMEGAAINVEITAQQIETPDKKVYYAIMFRDRDK